MFVPYETGSLFEVERHNDRCICGKSAVLSTNGYCQNCLEEKENFINYLVDKIENDNININSDYYRYIEQAESMRIFIMKQAISTFIDKFFAKQENSHQKFLGDSNRYNEYLYIACLEEKISLSNMFLEGIKPTLDKCKKNTTDTITAFKRIYYDDVVLQMKMDIDSLQSILKNEENSDCKAKKLKKYLYISV